MYNHLNDSHKSREGGNTKFTNKHKSGNNKRNVTTKKHNERSSYEQSDADEVRNTQFQFMTNTVAINAHAAVSLNRENCHLPTRYSKTSTKTSSDENEI